MNYKHRKYTKSFWKKGRELMNSSRPAEIYIEGLEGFTVYGVYLANWK